VARPARFEWTPLYFKEAQILGSSGYGIEHVEGRRAHAFEHFFALLASRRIDPAGLVTHRFELGQYKEAFLAARGGGAGPKGGGTVKAVFEFTAPM
jgi:threonine dehydrogenase-like Zn-dependent dehydrogenase